MNSIENLKSINSIALKPGSNDIVFVLACQDEVIRIFDIRISTTRTSILFIVFIAFNNSALSEIPFNYLNWINS